jgi:hypothetical protein
MRFLNVLFKMGTVLQHLIGWPKLEGTEHAAHRTLLTRVNK